MPVVPVILVSVWPVIGAMACGLTWGRPNAAWLIGFSALVPIFWQQCQSRWVATAVVLAYQLAGSRGLPAGAAVFFGDQAPSWYGWFLWFGAATATTAPWMILWSPHPGRRVWLMVANLALDTVPPIGWIAWTSPLTSAGILFPGFGFMGLFSLTVTLMALCHRSAPAIFAAIAMMAIALMANLTSTGAAPIAGWSGVDTDFSRLQTGSEAELIARVLRVVQVMAVIERDQLVVLPESVLPPIAEKSFANEMLKTASAQLKTRGGALLVGAEVERDNVLLGLGAADAILVQRVPVPISMWRPWTSEGFRAHPLETGIHMVLGKKVAELICYEQVLTYPVLLSMLDRPDLLIGAANDWWARGTSIPAIQSEAIDAWGRLFGVPVIRAVNL